MKNLILAVCSAAVFTAAAQTSIQISNFSTSVNIAPNAVVHATTIPENHVDMIFDVTNTSSVNTNIYKARKYEVKLDPTSVAYFCFAGLCYLASDSESLNSLTLTPGQKASAVSSTNQYNVLQVDLDEFEATRKHNIIKYTVFNVNVPADSVQITMNYNADLGPVGIKESEKEAFSFDVYPNPAKTVTAIKVNASKSGHVKITLFNSIGAVVLQKDATVSEGRNRVELNVDHLPSGVYIARLGDGANHTSKKIVIE
jgi:hypothetical protein